MVWTAKAYVSGQKLVLEVNIRPTGEKIPTKNSESKSPSTLISMNIKGRQYGVEQNMDHDQQIGQRCIHNLAEGCMEEYAKLCDFEAGSGISRIRRVELEELHRIKWITAQ